MSWQTVTLGLVVRIYCYFCSLAGKQLLYNYPKIYAHNLPEDFTADNENVLHAIDGTHVKAAPWTSLINLTSSAGQQFLSFAKYTEFAQGWSVIPWVLDQETGPQAVWRFFFFLGLLLTDFQCTKAFSFHNRSSLNSACTLVTTLSAIAPCRIFNLSPN